MAEQKTNSMTSEEIRNLLECPVCRQTFKNPKSLPCGHSICSLCCRNLSQNRIHIICPVCRQLSPVSHDNLPINFGLRDLIQHHVESFESKKVSCVRCNRKVSEEDCWLCRECRVIVCCSCALRYHQTHELDEIKLLMGQKIVETRNEHSNLIEKLKESEKIRRQIDFNRLKLANYGREITTTLRTKLIAQMETASKDLKQESEILVNRSKDFNAFQIISDELNGLPNDYLRLQTDLATFKEKQDAIIKKEEEAAEALRKCHDTLHSLLDIEEAQPRHHVQPVPYIRHRMVVANSHAAQRDNLTAEPDSDQDPRVISDVDVDSGEETNSEASAVPTVERTTPARNQPANRFCTSLYVGLRHDLEASSDDETTPRQQLAPESGRRRNVAAVRHRLMPNNRIHLQLRSPANAANNQGTLVVDVDDDDDSVDDMDVGPSSSNIATRSSAGHRSPTYPANRIGAQKRSRGADARRQDSSDTSDGDSRDGDVDSSIHFRILRKFNGKN